MTGMSAHSWQGEVDAGPEIQVFKFTLGRMMVRLSKQFTGDAYGQIGDRSWNWRLLIVRKQS